MSGNLNRYFNSTDTPFQMDEEGHMLGGGEFGDFVANPFATNGVRAGRLVMVGKVEDLEQQEADAQKGEGQKDADAVEQDRQPVKSRVKATSKSQEK